VPRRALVDAQSPMPGWLSRLFPVKTLASVREPTVVRIDARVFSPNTLVSPISGHTAALIVWRFLAHYTDRSGQTPVERYKLLWSCSRGEDIVLVTPQGRVLVPARGRVIKPAMTGRGVPLDVPLPPEAAELATWSAPGLMFYDELLLRNGDPVRLRATVGACGGKQGSAYRSGGEGGNDFEARPDLGAVVLEDLPFAE